MSHFNDLLPSAPLCLLSISAACSHSVDQHFDFKNWVLIAGDGLKWFQPLVIRDSKRVRQCEYLTQERAQEVLANLLH